MAPLSKEARERLIIALTSRKVGNEVSNAIDLSINIIPVDAPAPNTSLFFDGTDFIWAPASGGGGANTTLSNLDSPTNINQDLLFISSMGGPSIGHFDGGRPFEIYAQGRITVGDNLADRVDLYAGYIQFWQLDDFFGRISIGNEFTPFGSDVGLILHGPSNEPSITLLNNRITIGKYTPASGMDPQMHLIWNRDSNGDIGSSDDGVTKKRPRDVYIARDLFVDGTIKDSANVESIDINGHQLRDNSAGVSVDYGQRTLVDPSGANAADWNTRDLFDETGALAFSWGGSTRYVTTSLGTTSINFEERSLYFSTSQALDWSVVDNFILGDGLASQTIKVRQNIVANAVAAPDLTLEASNKTAGTGRGGTFYIYSGNSVGGKSGDIYIDASSLLSTSIDGGTVGIYGGTASSGLAGNVELSAGVSATGTHGSIVLYAAGLLIPHPVIEVAPNADLILGAMEASVDTIIYGRPNNDANGVKAQSIFIKGHDKSAGTGDGGDIYIRGGLSNGGVAGFLFLQGVGSLVQIKQDGSGTIFQGWQGHGFLQTNGQPTDGSDSHSFRVGGIWDPSGGAAQEGVKLGWNNANSRFELATFFGTPGVSRALDIYTEGNPGQLLLGTNGSVQIGASGDTVSIHKINGAIVAVGGATSTLTASPASAAGNPTVWLKLNIDGTNYIFPGWPTV